MEANESQFQERPTAWLVEDAYRLGAIPLGLSALFGVFGASSLALLLLVAAGFVAFFFRNPERQLPENPDAVVAPADGRVIEVGEIEREDGSKAVRVGIFLSVFNVHVNRAPVAGRVVEIERGGSEFLAAFDPKAAERNVYCRLGLETADGQRVDVTQITGLIARRIVCHPKQGEKLRRGDRYGLIRFGSRTDVVLPGHAEIRVVRGERVRGGRSEIARLAGSAG